MPVPRSWSPKEGCRGTIPPYNPPTTTNHRQPTASRSLRWRA
jgi:hypothetical protein